MEGSCAWWCMYFSFFKLKYSFLIYFYLNIIMIYNSATLHARTQYLSIDLISTLTDSWNSWVAQYLKRFTVSLMLLFYLQWYSFSMNIIIWNAVLHLTFLLSFSTFLLLALRGASSRRKKNSMPSCRSASQEVLSTVKEESQEERRAQSLENLDDTGASCTSHLRRVL